MQPRWNMKPTLEQDDAVARFASGAALKINAYAGTGKTTTLRLLAESTRRQGLYLAFNKSIAGDARAKFPARVQCSTIHSLALRSIASAYATPGKLNGQMNVNAIVDALALGPLLLSSKVGLQPRSLAFLVRETLRRFLHGERETLAAADVPRHGALALVDGDAMDALRDKVVAWTATIWRRMCDPRDLLPLGHDGYLKLWALSAPALPAEYLLLDEAQDSNPVVLSVLRKQQAQVVYVGDRYQQIYEWRGAVNAMERVETPHVTMLTQSFRFGPVIAALASAVLGVLGEHVPLRGNPAVESALVARAPNAMLGRGNATVLSHVIDELRRGGRPFVIGGTSELARLLQAIALLKVGIPSDVPELFGFERFEDLVHASESDEGADLRTVVKIVQTFGEQSLLAALSRTAAREEEASIVLSTAHKAKGREWDFVQLADDFLVRPKPRQRRVDPGELRLLYVALTRARLGLGLPHSLLQTFAPAPPWEAEEPEQDDPRDLVDEEHGRHHELTADCEPTVRQEPPEEYGPPESEPAPASHQPSAPPRSCRLPRVKFAAPSVTGWSCVGVEDLGTPSAQCQHCRKEIVRYLFHMKHEASGRALEVGCVCAGTLLGSVAVARDLEADIKSYAGRRARWLKRRWRVSAAGNGYIKLEGHHVVVYRVGRRWSYRLDGERAADTHASSDEAKYAALDELWILSGLED